MINRNILKLVVASSTIMGGIGLTANTVQAVEKNNNVNKNELTKDATKVSTQMKGKVVNVSSNLNVRIDAGTNYDTIGYVYNNQNIEILSEKNDWYRISFNGREGYVSKKYISVENAVLESKAQANKIKGKVINVNSILNIRQSTESNSAILGTLRNGDTFDIISKTGDWYNIRSNNIVGFVKATYVQRIEQNEVAMQNVINTIIQDYNVNKCESKISIQKGKVKNVSSNLRVRSAASTSAQIVGYLLNGSEVTIKGEVGNWYIIDFNGRNGFVTKEYIQKGSVQAIDSSTSSSKKGKVVNISSSLNIRSGAGTGHSIVGRLTNGATVDILGKNGGWYHVNSNGVTGYVSAEYLKEESSASGTQESKSTSGSTSSSKKGKVVNISSSLNIRSGAGTGHSIVGRLTNGVTVNILGKNGGWYHINSNGVTGYVSAEYLKEESSASGTQESKSTSGKVYNITTALRVRSAASTNSMVLGYLVNNQDVNIISKSNSWVKINYNGRPAYVSAEYIRDSSSSISSAQAKVIFDKVYSVMKAYIGTPYVWGGSGEFLTTSSLNVLQSRFAGHDYSRAKKYVNQGYRAFDCSGLMQWGFRQVGINIARTTFDQISNGYEVSLSNLQPGDLLFYGDLKHVGMYIGDGYWIEAPNSNANIRVVAVPWGKVKRARRVIG